ncbi:hypothetical protein OBJ96_10370 [Empedobacter falsenii]|uniref:hypothetical protein n=1 Tax=Empedobacter sp. TaxID=1927715 RepID=UPI0028A20337|nr:hypothetical protein [Empedobacter sp.]
MESTLSIVASICGIIGFLISIFAVSKVVKIEKRLNNSNNVSLKGNNNIGGDFVGRDKNS